MRAARAETVVPLAPEAAAALWRDVRRWPSFVEGFARVRELDEGWPAPGSGVVWESVPSGRGRVTEQVVSAQAGSFETRVSEERLQGSQAASFAEDEQGALVRVELTYELTRKGPLAALADALFVRRALRDSLRRTLGRFTAEAEEEAGLR